MGCWDTLIITTNGAIGNRQQRNERGLERERTALGAVSQGIATIVVGQDGLQWDGDGNVSGTGDPPALIVIRVSCARELE